MTISSIDLSNGYEKKEYDVQALKYISSYTGTIKKDGSIILKCNNSFDRDMHFPSEFLLRFKDGKQNTIDAGLGLDL